MLHDIIITYKLIKYSPKLYFDITDNFKEYFSKYPRLSTFSHKSKKAIFSDLKEKIIKIIISEKPHLEFRSIISEYIIQLSYFTVLSLTDDDKKESGFKSDKISAGLYKVLIQLIKNEIDLIEFSKNALSTNEEVFEFCKTRRLLLTYYVNSLNKLRSLIGDTITGNDWLLPFYEAMCIWQEDRIRQNSKLPSLLESEIESLAYSSFWNIVESGEKDPYLKWRDEMKDIIKTT